MSNVAPIRLLRFDGASESLLVVVGKSDAIRHIHLSAAQQAELLRDLAIHRFTETLNPTKGAV